MEQTVKCPICGEPYVGYSHYAGDQSACPRCREKARRNIQKRGKWDGLNYSFFEVEARFLPAKEKGGE